MKYRIRIECFQSGRKEYFAQVKTFLFWRYISATGTEAIDRFVVAQQDTREGALARIDRYHENASNKKDKVHTIEFEYINK